MGVAGIFKVDDVRRTYEELLAKGGEFTEEPTERFYGTDCRLRDPFGNHLRIGEPKEGPVRCPTPPSPPPAAADREDRRTQSRAPV